MLNRSKLLEFFDASKVTERVNVIGIGAIGSAVVEELTRLGFTNLHIYDFDTVDAHNITNQMYRQEDIGCTKLDAIENIAKTINSEINFTKHPEGLCQPYKLEGYTFLCVDNIDLRREITEANMYNIKCLMIMDFRMRLTDAQMYCGTNTWQYRELTKTMQFSHEEATEATPQSACGVTLSVCYAPRTIVNMGIANFIRFIQTKEILNVITIDMDTFELEKFAWKERKKKKKLIL